MLAKPHSSTSEKLTIYNILITKYYLTMTLSTGLAAAFGSNVRWGILSAGKISSDFVKAISITEGAGKFLYLCFI